MRDSEDFQQNSRSSGPPVEHPAALWSIFHSSHLKLWYAVTTWNVHESDERFVVLRTRRRATSYMYCHTAPWRSDSFSATGPVVRLRTATSAPSPATSRAQLSCPALPKPYQLWTTSNVQVGHPPTRDFQIPPIWNQAVASERHQESASTS